MRIKNNRQSRNPIPIPIVRQPWPFGTIPNWTRKYKSKDINDLDKNHGGWRNTSKTKGPLLDSFKEGMNRKIAYRRPSKSQNVDVHKYVRPPGPCVVNFSANNNVCAREKRMLGVAERVRVRVSTIIDALWLTIKLQAISLSLTHSHKGGRTQNAEHSIRHSKWRKTRIVWWNPSEYSCSVIWCLLNAKYK